MRFRLRTLLIVMALGPPVLAASWPYLRALVLHETPPIVTWREAYIAAGSVGSDRHGFIAEDYSSCEPNE
jgi:hypothetical protein